MPTKVDRVDSVFFEKASAGSCEVARREFRLRGKRGS